MRFSWLRLLMTFYCLYGQSKFSILQILTLHSFIPWFHLSLYFSAPILCDIHPFWHLQSWLFVSHIKIHFPTSPGKCLFVLGHGISPCYYLYPCTQLYLQCSLHAFNACSLFLAARVPHSIMTFAVKQNQIRLTSDLPVQNTAPDTQHT